MNIIGIGTDIVEIDRLSKKRNLDRVASFILTKREIGLMNKSRDILQYLVSRFAAKEAVIKAYPGKISYHDIEIVKKGTKVQAIFLRKLDHKLYSFLSIAHELKYAIAYAILYE